jgi:hypothetical protein
MNVTLWDRHQRRPSPTSNLGTQPEFQQRKAIRRFPKLYGNVSHFYSRGNISFFTNGSQVHQFVFPMWSSPLDIGSGQAISSGDTNGFGLMTRNTRERPVPV